MVLHLVALGIISGLVGLGLGGYGKVQAIKKASLPVDCVLGNWSDWSQCSTTEIACSGNGTQNRTRVITTLPLNGGKPCDVLSQQQACTSCIPLPPDTYFVYAPAKKTYIVFLATGLQFWDPTNASAIPLSPIDITPTNGQVISLSSYFLDISMIDHSVYIKDSSNTKYMDATLNWTTDPTQAMMFQVSKPWDLTTKTPGSTYVPSFRGFVKVDTNTHQMTVLPYPNMNDTQVLVPSELNPVTSSFQKYNISSTCPNQYWQYCPGGAGNNAPVQSFSAQIAYMPGFTDSNGVRILGTIMDQTSSLYWSVLSNGGLRFLSAPANNFDLVVNATTGTLAASGTWIYPGNPNIVATNVGFDMGCGGGLGFDPGAPSCTNVITTML